MDKIESKSEVSNIQENCPSLEDMPNEILVNIISYLDRVVDIKDILRTAHVSKRIRDICFNTLNAQICSSLFINMLMLKLWKLVRSSSIFMYLLTYWILIWKAWQLHERLGARIWLTIKSWTSEMIQLALASFIRKVHYLVWPKLLHYTSGFRFRS